MKRTGIKILTLVAAVLILSLGVFKAEAVQSNELVFVSIVPMTGPVAFLGVGPNRGQQMAVDDINAAGGLTIGGKKYMLKLITYDDRADPKETLTAATRAITQDKAKAILGLIMSASAPLVASECAKANVINFTSIASVESFLGQDHPYSFRSTTSNDICTSAIARFVGEKIPGVKRMVTLCMNESWGLTCSEMFKKKLPEYGIEFKSPVLYEWGATDFYTQLDKVKALKPDVLYLQIFITTDLAMLLRQVREVGITCPIITTDGLTEPTFLVGSVRKDAAALAASQPLYSFYHEPAEARDPEGRNKNLMARFKERYGEPMTHFGRDGYDEVMLAARGFELAGTVDDPDKVKEALLSLTYDGVMYPGQRFLPNGQIFLTEYFVRLNPDLSYTYIAEYPVKWDKKLKKAYIPPFK